MTLSEAMSEAMTEARSEAQSGAQGEDGIEAAIRTYRDLRERFGDRGVYDFSESSLNRIGYGLLGSGDTEGAVAIFRLNLEQFPRSANAHDSLAEGYLKAGQKELAEIFYRKSLELDPDHRNALDKLREMAASETAASEPVAPEAAREGDEGETGS